MTIPPWSDQEIRRARDETPGCEGVLHFNNAGSSLVSRPVLDEQVEYLRLEARRGGYEACDELRERFEGIYASVARLIGAEADQVAVLDSATRAWQAAFYSIPLRPGDRILTGVAEYGTNWLLLTKRARETGAVIDVVPNDESGQISILELERRAFDRGSGRVRLVSLTHVPSNGGLVNPAAEVGRIARQCGCLFLLDACQSVGQLPVDVRAIGCDFLTVTGRKFLRGPRGSGFLFVSPRALPQTDPVFIDLHHARNWRSDGSYELVETSRRFESFEMSYASRLALGTACEYALSWGAEGTGSLERIGSRIQGLAERLRDKLSAMRGVSVRDLGSRKCGIVTFTGERNGEEVPPDRVRRALFAEGIQIAVSVPEHAKLDMDRRGLSALLRASLHYYNTEDEIERFCAALERALST